jgi:hypothetical protein
MSDDIEKQLSMLEGKTTFASFGNKLIFIKLSISVLIGLAISYFSKSLYIFNIEIDSKDKSISYELNTKNFLISSFILSIGSFFVINQISYLSD